MITEFGHIALVLALGFGLIQSVLPIWGARTKDEQLMATTVPTAVASFGFVVLAFLALVIGYVRSDFSILNVYENSHSAQPLLYKITGVWGNHEGSMLLWVLILTTFGAAVAVFGRNIPETLRATTISVQGWILTAFLLFILLTSNPFVRLIPAPAEGRDLNPILQDIGLAIHPPLLYLGYVGFSISFAFAIAALIEGRLDAAWARWVRPWTLLAWTFLTLGIAMGSYWSYYELGWGGWWFWDPVENASFMPWLAGTALLHSAAVMEKRDALKVWTVLLAIVTFSLSLLGTFLVRSGVLTSVHAFATDPTRGAAILVILVTFIGGAFTLFAWRASALRTGGLFAPISREGALVLNNVFLVTACFTVLVGTLYPLALQALTGGKISVGPPFYRLTFVPLMLPLLIALPIGPLLAWKRADVVPAFQRLAMAGVAALAAVAMAYWVGGRGTGLTALLGFGVAAWLIVGAVQEVIERTRRGGSAQAIFRRLVGLPRSTWGAMLGHLGLGLTVLGIVSASTFSSEVITTLAPGGSTDVAGFHVTFENAGQRQGPNYSESYAKLDVQRPGGRLMVLDPSKRIYTARDMPTTEAAIRTMGLSQLYATLGSVEKSGIEVSLHYKPLVVLIWFGCIVMAAGGVLSLSDRRLRIGAPRPARFRRRLAEAEAEAMS